ncbi:hypothetical protein EV401DRAFT_1942915, partial [Pisolithus croceorrhizus]
MHHTAGVMESDAFGGTSADIPAMSAQRAQHQGPPVRNTQSKIKAFFSRILRRLSAHRKESGEVATRCEHPVAVAPGTRRGSGALDVASGVNEESDVLSRRTSIESAVPGCSPCCRACQDDSCNGDTSPLRNAEFSWLDCHESVQLYAATFRDIQHTSLSLTHS